MKCLLNTHTLLWVRSAPDLLSTQAVAALQSPSNELHVRVASPGECAIKSSIRSIRAILTRRPRYSESQRIVHEK